jgi:imidazoleglycerol-phosphate dehydratase
LLAKGRGLESAPARLRNVSAGQTGPLMRRANRQRNTTETQIELSLGLDGTGQRRIATPIPFFSHMLEAVAKHGLFDLDVKATGDVEVDAHHTVEDVGICLGQAFRQALGDKSGITRYGDALIPMDETLATGAVDFGGRAALVYRADALKGRWIGSFDAELAREFFGGFTGAALCNLHLEVRYGENAHHIVEALFKAFARATRAAVTVDPRVVGVPSTKGTLTG